tara:strand:- start:854 stop:1129 length:276 start_codon:yes stop_codon:yes gene_type:complete
MRANGRIIAMGAMQFGGETVESFLPDDYEGAVKVASASDCGETVIAVLPNFEQGLRVALFAMSPYGGSGSVELHPCTQTDVTHNNLNDVML